MNIKTIQESFENLKNKINKFCSFDKSVSIDTECQGYFTLDMIPKDSRNDEPAKIYGNVKIVYEDLQNALSSVTEQKKGDFLREAETFLSFTQDFVENHMQMIFEKDKKKKDELKKYLENKIDEKIKKIRNLQSLLNDIITIKVSIIIPVYNVEKYLRKCLDSVVNQTFKDLEIICVNDGSTDNSLQILKEYANKDNRIKIIDKEYGGVSSARNAGMDVMSGEYCYFVDSDDWININAIEKLVDIITTNDVDVVVHNISVEPDNSECVKLAHESLKWINFFEKEDGIYEIQKNLNTQMASVVWNKLYKIDIINKFHCRFAEGLVWEDNLFLWTYGIHCKNYYYLNEKLYCHLRQLNSIGSSQFSSKALDHLEIQKKIWETVKEYKNINDYKELLTKIYINVMKNRVFAKISSCDRKTALSRIKDYYRTTNHSNRILYLYLTYKFVPFVYNDRFKFLIAEFFSVRNTDNNHKVITLLGIKIKFKKQQKR